MILIQKMDKDLINFVNALINKRLKSNFKSIDRSDISQNVLIELFEKNINSIDGNQLVINGIIQYHLNKERRKSSKIVYFDQESFFDYVQEKTEFHTCNTNYLIDLWDDFVVNNTDIKIEHLQLFENIKILKKSYKECGANTSTDRKNVSRVYLRFKKFLKNKNVKLEDFYE